MSKDSTQAKNARVAIFAVAIALGMFGFGFAMVPLYSVFCKVTGLNGKVSGQSLVYNGAIDKKRTITIEFVATNNASLPWTFRPLLNKITLHPGENKRIAFFAKNNSPHTMTVQAIPSVTPGEAARYLKKTECFCFTSQTLKSGAALDMPVVFHIDPNIPAYIKTFTLSYTLFDVTK